MKRKLIKRNKNKLTTLYKRSKSSYFDLVDFISLIRTLNMRKQEQRVASKSEIILDYDNKREFFNRVLVPIIYKTRTGKMKSFGSSKMIKED